MKISKNNLIIKVFLLLLVSISIFTSSCYAKTNTYPTLSKDLLIENQYARFNEQNWETDYLIENGPNDNYRPNHYEEDKTPTTDGAYIVEVDVNLDDIKNIDTQQEHHPTVINTSAINVYYQGTSNHNPKQLAYPIPLQKSLQNGMMRAAVKIAESFFENNTIKFLFVIPEAFANSYSPSEKGHIETGFNLYDYTDSAAKAMVRGIITEIAKCALSIPLGLAPYVICIASEATLKHIAPELLALTAHDLFYSGYNFVYPEISMNETLIQQAKDSSKDVYFAAKGLYYDWGKDFHTVLIKAKIRQALTKVIKKYFFSENYQQ